MIRHRISVVVGPTVIERFHVMRYSIITTEPNAVVRPLHHRMAVMLHESDYRKWLEDGDQSVLKPYPPDEMEAVQINPLVNSVENDFPEVLDAPLPPAPHAQSSLF